MAGRNRCEEAAMFSRCKDTKRSGAGGARQGVLCNQSHSSFVQPRANPSETRAEPARSWGRSEAGLLFHRATCSLDHSFGADQLFGAGSSNDNTGPYGSWC